MEKKTSASLYDLRKRQGDQHTDLGDTRRLFLAKDGRLDIETDLAFQLTIRFSKDDLYRLSHRLIEIRKTELEQKAKLRKKAEAKAAKKEERESHDANR